MNAPEYPDGTEQHLSEVLQARAETMTGRSVDIAAATARAGRIRNRRRGAVAAMAAVVLIGTGAGVWAATRPGATSIRPVERPPVEGELRLSGLPQGLAPKLAWIEDSGPAPILHLPDGTSRDLPDPGAAVEEFTLRSDGVVVLQSDGWVVGLGADGGELFRERAKNLASTPTAGGEVVTAWTSDGPTGETGQGDVATTRQIRVLPFGATAPRDWGAPGRTLGDVIALDTTTGFCTEAVEGCGVSTNDEPVPRTHYADRAHPAVQGLDAKPSPLRSLMDLQSSAGDSPFVATGTSADCSGLYAVDPANEGRSSPPPAYQEPDCSTTLGLISPDAGRVTLSGGDPIASGTDLERDVARNAIGMYDVPNRRQVWWRTTAPQASDPVALGVARWEDADHLLVAASTDRTSWQLVRYDAQGNGEIVSPRVRGTVDGPPSVVVQTDG